MTNVLTVKHLSKIFYSSRRYFFFKKILTSFHGNRRHLFRLKRGEILGILGPNGAGKTTTLAMLLGTLTPTRGSIHYFGKDFFQNKESLFKTFPTPAPIKNSQNL